MMSKSISFSEPVSSFPSSGVALPQRHLTARADSMLAHAAGVKESEVDMVLGGA